MSQHDELPPEDQIYRMFLHAIGTGSELKVKYTMKAKPTIRDLDGIEKAINGLTCAILRDLGVKLPRRRVFQLDLQDLQHLDDGEDNAVIVRLDFGKLMPGERPPEMLEAARSLFPDDEPDAEVAMAPGEIPPEG